VLEIGSKTGATNELFFKFPADSKTRECLFDIIIFSVLEIGSRTSELFFKSTAASLTSEAISLEIYCFLCLCHQ